MKGDAIENSGAGWSMLVAPAGARLRGAIDSDFGTGKIPEIPPFRARLQNWSQ